MENKCSKITLKFFSKAPFIPFRKNMLPNIEMGISDSRQGQERVLVLKRKKKKNLKKTPHTYSVSKEMNGSSETRFLYTFLLDYLLW